MVNIHSPSSSFSPRKVTPVPNVQPIDDIFITFVPLSVFGAKDFEDIKLFLVKIDLTLTTEERRFATTPTLDFSTLVDRGVFIVVVKSEAHSHQIFGSQIVDFVRVYGQANAFEHSRLVVYMYINKKHLMLTHAPTLKCLLVCLLLSIIAMDDDLKYFSHDVSQAYV